MPFLCPAPERKNRNKNTTALGGGVLFLSLILRNHFRRNWHQALRAGCRASKGRIPPPLWMSAGSIHLLAIRIAARPFPCQGNPIRPLRLSASSIMRHGVDRCLQRPSHAHYDPYRCRPFENGARYRLDQADTLGMRTSLERSFRYRIITVPRRHLFGCPRDLESVPRNHLQDQKTSHLVDGA
jgi:hypothetical protein